LELPTIFFPYLTRNPQLLQHFLAVAMRAYI
jgi:hypothetical protein